MRSLKCKVLIPTLHQDLTKEVNMSLWKKFTLVFSATSILRATVIGGSIWLFLYAIQTSDTGLISFSILIILVGSLWAIISFLEIFLGKFYIVPEHFLSQTEKTIDHVEKLKEIVEMPESTTKDALKEAYFEVIQETLEYMKTHLK
jgi:hypothetical protein